MGTSQSGHVAQVGYEMYLDLLEQAIQEIKGEQPPPRIDPDIRLKLEALIPEDYVPDPQQRMNLYKRLSRAAESAEIDEIEEEIVDLYGQAPFQVSHLMQVMRIRLAMKEVRIQRLDYNEQDLVLSFDSETQVNPQILIAWAHKDRRIRLLPGDRLAFHVGKVDSASRINKCISLLERLREAINGRGSSPAGVPPPL